MILSNVDPTRGWASAGSPRMTREGDDMVSTAPAPYYDPYDFDIDADPYPVWKRLRDEAPLYYNEKYDFYAISRYDDVERASDLAGEHHFAVGRRLDLGARRGCVVEAAVARSLRGRRRAERIGDRRGNRRLVSARSGRVRWRGARDGDDEHGSDANSQNGEAHRVPPRFE